jgi:hypothetical protein
MLEGNVLVPCVKRKHYLVTNNDDDDDDKTVRSYSSRSSLDCSLKCIILK